MLFDPRPKARREDLYDFDAELEKLLRALGEPMVLVSGLRRTGKTSLVLTALNESGLPYVYVDLREGFTSTRELYALLSRSLSEFAERASRWRRAGELLLKLLSRVRGVSVMGFQVSVSWSPRERPLVSELFAALDELGERLGSKVVVVLDEFQRSRGSVGAALHSAVAHSYDFHENLSFVLTGSEMGLLYGILRNPENPLYGRAYVEVRTRKLSREESVDFLERGFAELGVEVGRGELERAAEELGGVIGWLTYYGYLRASGRGDLERVVEEAVELARSELENFLATRVSRRYRLALKLLAQGVKEWGRLKRALEDAEGRELSDRVLHEILHQLRSHSIVDEENNFTDPIVRRAALQL